MSQVLTLELNEQVFAAIEQQAQALGISPAQLVATVLEQRFVEAFKLFLDEAERNAARQRFEHHFGTLMLEGATDLDNEIIDADILKEYTNSHENE